MAHYKSDLVDVNLNTGNIHRSFLSHAIGQKDDDADRFGVRTFRDGVPVDLSGASCHAWFTNSQGTTIALTSYGTVSGNEAYVTLPPACYDYDGQFTLAIKIVGGGVSSTVRIVDGMVDNINVGGAVTPTEAVPTYSEILSQYDAMVAATAAANTAIADTFDATQDYPAGKYVINDGALYLLPYGHEADVTWANTSKTAVNIGDETTGLRNAINAFDLKLLEHNEIDFSNLTQQKWNVTNAGKWLSIASANSSYSYVVEIPENTVAVSVESNANGSIVAFLNSFSPVSGELVDFSTGYNGRVVMDGGIKKVFYTTNDTKYLYVLSRNTSNVDMLPDVVFSKNGTKTLVDEMVIPSLFNYNSIDAFELYPSESREHNGVTYTKNADGSWTVYGEATAVSFCNLLGLSSALPEYVVPGRKYRLSMNGGSIPVQVYIYTNDASASETYTDDAEIEIPSDAIGIIVRLRVPNLQEVDETIRYTFIGESLFGSGGTIIENEYKYITTYNITTNPTITTDTNGWLQPVDTETDDETGKTDMTGAIMSMLTDTGYCHLAEGIFYVSGNIVMPPNSTLEGCGFGSKIRLLAGYEATVISMKANCTVKNLAIEGSYDSIVPSSNIGGRNGIDWIRATNESGVVTQCKITRFDGAGILMQDTSTPVYRNLAVSDCFIRNCNVGIYIKKNSEFHKITNCTITACYYGFLSRGGNNDLSNSGIDGNRVGIQIDSDEGTNGGHGTITGCSINHSDSNSGYGLIIKDTGRMLVSNCNLYYSKIKLENTNGNVISNCGFGSSAGWEVSGGDCNMFSGCMIRSAVDTPITITNNTQTKIVNCYDRAGNAVSAS